MKRHRTHEHNLLMERMCDEFNAAHNVRELSLVAHLYLEYFVNELVVAKFTNATLVIDDGELGTFGGKMTLLKAFGLFTAAPHVQQNVQLIQKIRNFYAHNLLIEDAVPDQVANRIRELVYFDSGMVCDYDEPWAAHEDPLLTQLHVCGIATTNGLIEIRETLP